MSAGKHISDDKIVAIIARIADGYSLKKACSEAGFEYTNVVRRIRASEELSQLDAQAREDYMRTRVEMLDDVARTEPDVQRARLMCDNIKWEAARIARKTYGDKVTQEHVGAGGGPVAFVLYGERESEDANSWQEQHSPK